MPFSRFDVLMWCVVLYNDAVPKAPDLVHDDRCCMAVHIAFHSFGFDATLFYLYHRLWSFKVPQSTIPVRYTGLNIPCVALTISRSFSFDWWLWLAFTGVSIGCVSRYVYLPLVLGACLNGKCFKVSN